MVEDVAYSRRKMNGGFEKCEERYCYYKTVITLEILEEFMRNRVD